MGKKNKSRFDLPKQLFVSRVGVGNDSKLRDGSYFESQTNIKKLSDVLDAKGADIPVGIYRLQEVGEITTETSYKRKRFTKV